MTYERTIVDNNLLRRITQVGKYDLYEKYIIQLARRGLIDIKVAKLYFTSAGVLEYLGQTMPIVETDRPEYFHTQAKVILASEKVDATSIYRLRADLLNDYEEKIRSSKLFSKENMLKWIKERRTRTEPKIHNFVFDIIERGFLNGKARSLMYNRVALDRTFIFPWEACFVSHVNASYLAELHQAYEIGLSFGSTRAMSQVWLDFSEEAIRSIEYLKAEEAGTQAVLNKPKLTFKKGLLTLGQAIENIRATTSRVKFKENGDFTDVEAIHFLCVGRFFNDECHPILFSTQDSFGDLIVRIALFRSFYKVSYEMVKGDDSAVPPRREGVALQFDQEINLKYQIQVEDVDPLLEVIANFKLEEWIEKMKLKFHVEV